MTSSEKIKIRKMKRRGESYAKIAKTVGVPVSTIKSFCRRNNLQKAGFKDNKILNECKNCKLKLNKTRKNKKFCSDKCRMMWWNKNLDKVFKTAVYELQCNHCNRFFESYGNKNRKFCSKKCYFSNRYHKSA